MRGATLVAGGEERVADRTLEVGGFAQGSKIFERSNAGLAAGAVRGDNLLILNPIDETPPGQLPEKAVGLLVFCEPVEHRAGRGEFDRTNSVSARYIQ